MTKRLGSSLLATASAVAALVAAGVGGYVTYSKVIGGCGSCHSENGAATTAVSNDAAALPACCGGGEKTDSSVQTVSAESVEKSHGCCQKSTDSASVKTVSNETTSKAEGCCQAKAAAECCKASGKECKPSECAKSCDDEKDANKDTSSKDEPATQPSEG